MTKGIGIIALIVLQMASINYVTAAPRHYVDTAVTDPDAWVQDGKHVECRITVVEDLTMSFVEFPELKSGVLMVSDSGTTLGAIRIMDKHQIAKSISAPRITCKVGDSANVSTQPDAAEKTKGNSDGIHVEVVPRAVQKGAEGMEMTIELRARIDQGGERQDRAVGFLVKEGQTAVVKASQHPTRMSAGNHPPVYIVVTPKLVK